MHGDLQAYGLTSHPFYHWDSLWPENCQYWGSVGWVRLKAGRGLKTRQLQLCSARASQRQKKWGKKIIISRCLMLASLNALLLCRSRCAPIIFPWCLQDKSGLLPCTHTRTTMRGNNSSWGVMNDTLVPTGPCRCMFKWMGLNLTIEMTGHSFLGHGAGYMNGLWRRGAAWLMPHEKEPANLRKKTRKNHPCHICQCLENPPVVVLFLNLALLILFTTGSLLEGAYTSPHPTQMVPFIAFWHFCHQWPTMLVNEVFK